VLLHGLGQHSADYHRFGRVLRRHGIETWAIDHIGHGLSEGDPETIAPIQQLAANALRLTTLIRATHPVLPMVMVGHSLGAGTAVVAMRSDAADVSGISAVALSGTPNDVATLEVPAPSVPTLVLHGVDDRRAPIGPIREWAARWPHTRMREFTDAGHDLLHEPVHRAVTSAVVEFTENASSRVAREDFPVETVSTVTTDRKDAPEAGAARTDKPMVHRPPHYAAIKK
jgi:alpha-beta hydrolase superfamily lysophospholipase